MSEEKSLQKLTEFEKKLLRLITLERITRKDISDFTEEERISFFTYLRERDSDFELRGYERDAFLKKFDAFMSKETRNRKWEGNHNQIGYIITALMKENGRMPSSAEIADQCKLSRQTISKHLNEFSTHSLYREQVEQFRLLSSRLLAKIYDLSINGDIRAARLYFEMVGSLKGQSNNTFIQNQNNYIQINGTVLSQDTIKKLRPEQLIQIEAILKTALSQTTGKVNSNII